MPRQLIRRKISSLRRGSNARKILGPEEHARALWRSYKKQPIHPFLISLPDLIRDGARRHWGAELEGDGDCEVDCLVVEGNLSEPQITTLQLVSAIHRADLSAYDKAVAIRDIKAGYPGMTNRHLAEDILDIDPSSVTQNLALFDRCIPEVQEAAMAGKIGLTDWYTIAKSGDQKAALDLILNGSSSDERENETQHADGDGEPANSQSPGHTPTPDTTLNGSSHGEKPRHGSGNGKSPSRSGTMTIPLVTDTTRGTVIVSGVIVSGDASDYPTAEKLLAEAKKAVRVPRIKISPSSDGPVITVTGAEEAAVLDATETLIKEAIEAVKDARERNLKIKTAQAFWRDKAGGAK